MSGPGSQQGAALPVFRYHPDPLATGAVAAKPVVCQVCRQERSHRYTLPVYSERDVDLVCPWCIADGSLAATFDAFLNDITGHLTPGFEDDPDWAGWSTPPYLRIPEAVRDEVCRRTPGFSSWQEVGWLVCCNDAMQHLGLADSCAIEHEPGLRRALEEVGVPGEFIAELRADINASILCHWFRCLHCTTSRGFVDSD